MKFKFTKNLEYQLEAIKAVVDIFDTGQSVISPDIKNDAFFFSQIDSVVVNSMYPEVEKRKWLENIKAIQKRNKIETISENVDSMDFSIEMETGTGKTYVYLRTIFELAQKYGLKKFIILVPSVAIREGVLKTLEQTKQHFKEIYNINYGYFAYTSEKLSEVRDFAQSFDVQIMIMTIQSFNNDSNILRQTPDRFNGNKPLDLIAQTNPVVIMDEPQNMESELSQASISDLKPLFKLRCSATHKEIHNLVYRLTPVDAYRQGLVKKISVYGVKENDPNALLFKVTDIKAEKTGLKANVLVEIKNTDETYSNAEISVKVGDDLEKKTKGNKKYAGMIVTDINARMNRVEIGADFYHLEVENENKEVIFRTQIQQTIKTHFDKQQEIGNQIKVLSLFFIDKVSNYVDEESLIRKIFIEEFTKLQKNYPQFEDVDVSTVHKGYFASKKVKGVIEYKDSTSGSSKEDKEAYDLIMKNKEQLLSFNEPVSFIFSHSALKEGWDNPNIFQICTLRETQSVMKKRQEIGRGLRLPVDINGDRIYDPKINILTVVANSSYEEYANGLQQEFKEAGYSGQTEIQNAREQKIKVKTTKHLDSQDFQELWKRISRRTVFNLEVLSDTLVKNVVSEINQFDIQQIGIVVERGDISFDKFGNVKSVRESNAVGYSAHSKVAIHNIVDRITQDTGLTRKTIFEIISQVENLDLIFENTEEYIRKIIHCIKKELNNLFINDGLKYIPTGESWEIKLLFSDFESLPSKVIPSIRSVFDYIAYDSNGEREFAQSLENSRHVKVYTKLPRGFSIDTPFGQYIPDWAIVWERDGEERLYLVRETKFGYSDMERELSQVELDKIKCGKKHFEAIGVNFKVNTQTDLSDLI